MKSENIFTSDGRELRLAILVLPDSNALSLAATLDPFRVANRLTGTTAFDMQVYSVDTPTLRLTSGLEILTTPLPNNLDVDFLVVVSGFNQDTHCTPDLLSRLRRIAPNMQAIAGVDGGSWVLARAGFLEHRRVTTHWEDIEAMSDLFPKTEIVKDRFVIDGGYLSCGGAAPCIDMMLHIIQSRLGRALAENVAQAFIYDPIHAASDAQTLVSVTHLQKRAPKVAAAIKIMEASLEDPPTTAQIARQCGLSQRHLEILFQQEFSRSPAAYFRSWRLHHARRLVLETVTPLHDVAVRCGFNSLAAFSRAFRSEFNTSARDLRSRKFA